MQPHVRKVVMFLLVNLVWVSQGLCGDAQQGKKLVLDLPECINRALTAAPEVGEAKSDIALAASKLDEAKGYRFPEIDILGLTGPVPQAHYTGSFTNTTDSIDNTKKLTYFFRGDATITQPLYTFGKISENMTAATHGIEVDRSKKEQVRNEIALKTKEYYYGILLAREMTNLLLDVQETLKKARDKAQKLFDAGSPNVVLEDIYKLDSFSGEVANYLAEASKGEKLALAALKTRVGLPADTELDIASESLSTDEAGVPELASYLATSLLKRPEYRQIAEGLKAREALVKAERANYFPDIFLAAYLSGAWSEGRDRENNPWVPDEYNHGWAGIALGVKWKIDFGITRAKVEGKRAEYNRLLSTSEYANANIPLQIRKYYLDFNEAEDGIKATGDGYRNAKKWEVAAVSNFDFGIGAAKEIFDALQQYAKMKAAYLQSLYNRKMALANLVYAVGEDPLAAK